MWRSVSYQPYSLIRLYNCTKIIWLLIIMLSLHLMGVTALNLKMFFGKCDKIHIYKVNTRRALGQCDWTSTFACLFARFHRLHRRSEPAGDGRRRREAHRFVPAAERCGGGGRGRRRVDRRCIRSARRWRWAAEVCRLVELDGSGL